MKKLIFVMVMFLVAVGIASAAECNLGVVEDCTVSDNMQLPRGVYYLNDTNQNGGIFINADNLTLDCNHSQFIGNSSTLSYGLYGSGRDNITIKNCHMYNYSRGMRIRSFNDSIVANSSVNNNQVHGILIDSIGNNITLNNISIGSPGDYEKSATAYAVTVDGGDNVVIKNSKIYLANSNGLWIHPVNFALNNIQVYNNEITFLNDTNLYGIMAGYESGQANTVTSNLIHSNTITAPTGTSGRHMILLGYNNDSSAYNNTITGGSYGIVSKGNDRPLVYLNTISGTGTVGLLDKGSHDGNYYNNTITTSGTVPAIWINFNSADYRNSTSARIDYNTLTSSAEEILLKNNITNVTYRDSGQNGAINIKSLEENNITFAEVNSEYNDLYNVSGGNYIMNITAPYTLTINTGETFTLSDYELLNRPLGETATKFITALAGFAVFFGIIFTALVAGIILMALNGQLNLTDLRSGAAALVLSAILVGIGMVVMIMIAVTI